MKKKFEIVISWAYANSKHYSLKNIEKNVDILNITRKGITGVTFFLMLYLDCAFAAYYTQYLGLKWEKNLITYGLSALCFLSAYLFSRRLTSDLTIEKLEALIDGKDIIKLREYWYILVMILFLILFFLIWIAIKK
jgi:hypothetical protein